MIFGFRNLALRPTRHAEWGVWESNQSPNTCSSRGSPFNRLPRPVDPTFVLGKGGINGLGSNASPNRRRHPRLRCENITCGIGELVDISISGARIVRPVELTTRIGQEIAFELTSPEGKILVLAKVVRSLKPKGGRFEYGLEWVKHDERLQAAVKALARSVVYNETMLPDIERARKSEW